MSVCGSNQTILICMNITRVGIFSMIYPNDMHFTGPVLNFGPLCGGNCHRGCH